MTFPSDRPCVICGLPARAHLSTCGDCGARVDAARDEPAEQLAERLRASVGGMDTCRGCGQTVLGERDAHGSFRCYECADRDQAPQGTQERLFTPAPAQMPGQTTMGSWDELA